MCTSDSAATPPAQHLYEHVDSTGNVVDPTAPGATKRRRLLGPRSGEMASILGGNDSAGNTAGVGGDASGNGNAGGSASGW